MENVADFVFLTMQQEAYKQLRRKGVNAYYLPSEFSRCTVNSDEVESTDRKFEERFGYGINYLYAIERFKPEEQSGQFVESHVSVLHRLIPKNAVLVSITMDHFAYILAGHINIIKGGRNYYVQPSGFPQNANVVFNTPWEMAPISGNGANKEQLARFIESLDRPPEETIHYMRKGSPMKRTLLERAHYRIELLRKWMRSRRLRSMFHYLEPKVRFPSLWWLTSQNNEPPMTYYGIEQIKEKSKSCKVFYYPLHLEPEMSILAYSPFYQNQLEIIRIVAKHLRRGDLLVLKENPKMVGKRAVEFYKETLRMPNVIWASSKTNSREVIRVSFKVIAISGTATVEAASLGINSILFGYPPFHRVLKSSVLSDVPIRELPKYLYEEFSSADILSHLQDQWGQYSQHILIADFVPKFNGETEALADVDGLVSRFAQNVLGLRSLE